MSAIVVDSLVRLTRDVPLNCLRRGAVGVVRSLWFAPDGAYEIEFRVAGQEYPIRTVLPARDLAVEHDRTPADADGAAEHELAGAYSGG